MRTLLSIKMDDINPRARQWLHTRRLYDPTLIRHGIGYNPADQYVDRSLWGLPPKLNAKGRPAQLLIPRGIVIPWFVDGDLWGIRIRRPVGKTKDSKAAKYYWIQGGAMTLYNMDRVRAGTPTVLVEGELDALTIMQETGGAVAAVATGSTVLVAYDSDEAGEAAATWWLDALSNARRWRPYWADANAMAQDGVDIARWVRAGLQAAGPAEADMAEELLHEC
jgi:DNA primase